MYNTCMKIGFFTDAYSVSSRHGVDVSITTHKKTLKRMGHDIYIYAPRENDRKNESDDIIYFKSIRILKNPDLKYAINFWPISQKKYRERVAELDIIHAHTPFSLGLLAKRVSERQQIPLIYTYHTFYPDYFGIYLKEKKLIPKIAKEYDTWFCNSCDAIIAPSQKIKNFLTDIGVSKDIHILPTGIDLKKFSGKKNQLIRNRFKIGSDLPVLLSVGRIAREKNPDFLLEAFSILLKKRGAVLILAGHGPYLNKLKRRIRELRIEKSVILPGHIPYEEIHHYYRAADVFVFASKTETQGLVALEAMASGLPVVAVKDDAFDNMLIDQKNSFLIDSDDPKDFSAKIETVLANQKIAESFANYSLKIVRNFSEEETTKKLEQIYRQYLDINAKVLPDKVTGGKGN